MVYRRGRLIAVCFFIFLVTLRFYTHPRRSIYDITEGKTSGPWNSKWNNPIKPPNASVTNGTTDEYATYLRSLARKHGLTSKIPFFARRVQPKYSSAAVKYRPSLTEVKTPFMKPPLGFTHAHIEDDALKLGQDVEKKPIALPMGRAISASRKPASIDASSLLFGISSTYGRLVYADKALLHDWAAWLTDGRGASNGAGLVLSLHGASEAQVAAIRKSLHQLGVDVTVSASVEGETDAGGRYAQLVQQMMRRRHREPDRAYFALIDDDVFFPCLGRLLTHLRRFDPAGTYYIGVPSERADWVIDENTAMTYGGGAVFLTASMLDMAGQLLCLQYTKTGGQTNTVDDDQGKSWDVSLHECIARHSPDTKLHVLPGLYTPSHRPGDTTTTIHGYSHGVTPLALHRYRNYHRFEAGKGHTVTAACGEACFLQRFLFRDDNWVLVNGYTITHYPDNLIAHKRQQQHQSESESSSSKKKKVYNTAPPPAIITPSEKILLVVINDDGGDEDESSSSKKGNGKDTYYSLAWQGRTKTFRLLDAVVRDDGEVWQAYVNRKGGGNGNGNAADDRLDDRQPGDIVHHEEGEEKSDLDSVILLVWVP